MEFIQEKRNSWYPFEPVGNVDERIQLQILDFGCFIPSSVNMDNDQFATVTSIESLNTGTTDVVVEVPTDGSVITLTFTITHSPDKFSYQKIYATDPTGAYGYIIADAYEGLYDLSGTVSYSLGTALNIKPTLVHNPHRRRVDQLYVANTYSTLYSHPTCYTPTTPAEDTTPPELVMSDQGRVVFLSGKQCQVVVNRESNTIDLSPEVLPANQTECDTVERALPPAYTADDPEPSCEGTITSINGVNVQEGTNSINISGGFGVSIASGGASLINMVIDPGIVQDNG